jgi:hypothetical protein
VGGIDGIGAPLFDEGLFERSAETSYRPTPESLPPRADDYFSRENIDKRAEESRRRDRELREQPEKEFIYEPQPTKYFKSGTQYIYATIGDKTPFRNAWQLFVTVKRDKPIKRRGTGKTEYYDFVEIWIPKSKAYVVKRLDKPIYLGAGAFPIEYILGVDEYFWFDKIDEQRYNKYYNQFEYIYPGDALDNLDEDEGLGKPSAKFEFDDETARKDFLDELQKIAWDYNVKLTTGGTGGKPKIKSLDKSIFDDPPQPAQTPEPQAPDDKAPVEIKGRPYVLPDNAKGFWEVKLSNEPPLYAPEGYVATALVMFPSF